MFKLGFYDTSVHSKRKVAGTYIIQILYKSLSWKFINFVKNDVIMKVLILLIKNSYTWGVF